MLVAEVEGKVVGNIDLERRRGRRIHCANLGMAVHDDFQDQGIGTRLMQEAISAADNWLSFKRIELQVFTDNDRAIHLYKKFGFVVEGTHRAALFRDGAYADIHTMARVREQR